MPPQGAGLESRTAHVDQNCISTVTNLHVLIGGACLTKFYYIIVQTRKVLKGGSAQWKYGPMQRDLKMQSSHMVCAMFTAHLNAVPLP